MSYWLGIDVGTTFTAAAICRAEPGRLPEVVALGTRSTVVSSVLYLAADGQVVVGEAAERRALSDPDRVVREFKRRIGDEVPMVVGGVAHSAPQLAAMVIRWVIERISQREGGAASAVVITHPAAWGPYKIQTVADAVRAAGLPEVSFRTEPEAAAASYALHERIDTGSTIAVYDLGGGTFDAAVVRKTGARTFSLLGAPQGIEALGGLDFDDAVFRHVLAAVPALTQLDPEDPATLTATAALRRECTEAKEALSIDTVVSIPVLAPGIQSQVRLVRAEFEDMIRPQVLATVQALRRALRSAALTPHDLDTILLVGGSSRIPLVAQLVSAELARPLAIDTDPKTTIALGAALTALPPEITQAPHPTTQPTTTQPTTTHPPAPTHTPTRPPLPTTPLHVEPAEVHSRQTSSRRVKQVTLAGALALVTAAGVASVPFLTSRTGPLAPANAGTANAGTPSKSSAPATSGTPPTGAAGPAANAGGGGYENENSRSAGVVRTTPPGAPRKPAGGAANPGPAPTSAPQSTWVTTYTWTTSWSIPPPSQTTQSSTPSSNPSSSPSSAPPPAQRGGK
jgi:molecular chaperone DnaK